MLTRGEMVRRLLVMAIAWYTHSVVVASAHPLGASSYSLYHALRMSEEKLSVVVVLEVPRDVVLNDIRGRITDGASKKRAVKDHDASRFLALSEGLTLTVNGKRSDVQWRPLANASNGKLVDEFFMYWVGAEVPMGAASSVAVQLTDTTYQSEEVVYSGSVQALDPWRVTVNGASQVLGADPSTMERTDPKAWTSDAALRSLQGAWEKS